MRSIYCLVRAESDEQAYVRVVKSLQNRKIYHALSPSERRKIISIAADFSLPSLGRKQAEYDLLASQVHALYHCAWNVNFNLRLASFEKDIVGLKALIDLCIRASKQKPARFLFCSSVGAVVQTKDAIVPEALPTDFSVIQHTGYAQSKLVAEHICSNAISQTAIPLSVIRIGQLVGDTVHGIWNYSEAIPLMLQTATTFGVLPAIDEELRWIPVDLAAQILVEIADYPDSGSGFFNLANPRTLHWTRDLLPYLQDAGLKFDMLAPPAWIESIRTRTDPVRNPAIKLLNYLVKNYNTTAPRRVINFQTDHACKFSETFSGLTAPDGQLVRKIVRHLTSSCWNTSEQSEPMQIAVVIAASASSMATDRLSGSLSSELGVTEMTGYSWLRQMESVNDAKESNTTTWRISVINGGPVNRNDREHFRKCAKLEYQMLFIMLEHADSPSKPEFSVTGDEADVMTFDASESAEKLLADAMTLAKVWSH